MSVPASGAEAVRRRPELYLGPDRKLETLVAWALLDPVLSQGTHWTHIDAHWSEDGTVVITDDDLSLPSGFAESGRTIVEERLTNLYVGAVPRGAALLPVVALCDWFVIELHRPEGLYRQRFERGVPMQVEMGTSNPPWRTRLALRPDLRIVQAHAPLTAASLILEAQLQLARAAAEPQHALPGGTPVAEVLFHALPDGVTLVQRA
jgi:DNA gyrase/topoisomerase IV subunit B